MFIYSYLSGTKVRTLFLISNNFRNNFAENLEQIMQDTVKERLMDFIKSQKLSINRFEQECGLSGGYVRNMRRSISPDKLGNIVTNFPELNPGWLMTGEGDMLRSGATNNQTARVGNVTATATSSGPDSSELVALRAENESLRAQVDRLTKIIENLTTK